MDNLLGQFSGLDLFVREPLALLGDVPDVNGGLWAKLHAAQAADAVGAEAGLAADKLDIVLGHTVTQVPQPIVNADSYAFDIWR